MHTLHTHNTHRHMHIQLTHTPPHPHAHAHAQTQHFHWSVIHITLPFMASGKVNLKNAVTRWKWVWADWLLRAPRLPLSSLCGMSAWRTSCPPGLPTYILQPFKVRVATQLQDHVYNSDWYHVGRLSGLYTPGVYHSSPNGAVWEWSILFYVAM